MATAALPALMATTASDDNGGRFYGPSGLGSLGSLGGPPAEQSLYASLRSPEDAARMWELTQQLTCVPFPTV